MQQRSSRLQRLASLAEAEERQYALVIRLSQARLREQLDRLTELNAYRQKYASALQQHPELQSAHLKDQQDFLSRLDQAVRSQQQIVSDCERKFETQRRQWQQKRQRTESLLRVMQRFQADERAHAERLEQRSLDDRPLPPDFFESDD